MGKQKAIIKFSPNNIPKLLRSLDQWLVWKAFSEKPDGRYDKCPICPKRGFKVNGLES